LEFGSIAKAGAATAKAAERAERGLAFANCRATVGHRLLTGR